MLLGLQRKGLRMGRFCGLQTVLQLLHLGMGLLQLFGLLRALFLKRLPILLPLRFQPGQLFLLSALGRHSLLGFLARAIQILQYPVLLQLGIVL